MIKVLINKQELHRLQRALDPRQYAEASVNTINATVRAVHSQSERNVKQKLTVRSPAYTLGSLRYSPAKVRSSGRAGYAEVGSISPYLPLQEAGAVVRARRSRIAAPTLAGRGGDKKRAIPPRLRINRMRAGQAGSRFFLLSPARKFKPRAGRQSPRLKQPGIFHRTKAGLTLVRSLAYKHFKLSPRTWHSQAVAKFGKRSLMEQVFVREAKKLLGAIK